MKFETKAIHVGQSPDSATGAVTTPIYQTSTYFQESPGKHKGYEYSRTGNPTRTALEECLASLENCKYGLAFSSGMAAINTVMGLLKAGDNIISTLDVYGGTYRLFKNVFNNYGLTFTFVDATNPKNVTNAITPETKMLWVETPTNPLLKIIDLKSFADMGKKHNLITVVDNTFATPYFQRPVDFGIDIVLHSATKYLGGHSDVIAGAVTTNNETYYKRLKFCQNAIGGVPGPFDSWLVLRGIKTLVVRMKEHFSNALKIAEFLNSHPKVEKTYFPYLPSDPQYKLAKKQMSGMSGMIAFDIKGGYKETKKFLESVKFFTLAESLGGVESLISHPATMSHSSLTTEDKTKMGIKDNLIRLSVGIENVDDLLKDIEQALEK
ncbi:MAG: cystathionine gamma-synthase [bacterium]|nr:cystathionine gamma-synthase [bacterium]